MGLVSLVPKSEAVINGNISTMDSFSAKDFKGFHRGRKANYPSVTYEHNGGVKRVTFSAEEFRVNNPTCAVDKGDAWEITYPDKATASEGDRTPTAVSAVIEEVVAEAPKAKAKK